MPGPMLTNAGGGEGVAHVEQPLQSSVYVHLVCQVAVFRPHQGLQGAAAGSGSDRPR